MTAQKIKAIVETHEAGYAVSCDEFPGITGYAKTIDRAKKNFISSVRDCTDLPFEVEYKYSITKLFRLLGVFDLGAFGARVRMSTTRLKQFRDGTLHATEVEMSRIREGLLSLRSEVINTQL